MRPRSRIALLAVALVAATGAGHNASACINIHVAPSVDKAGPGDAVGFTISTLVAGAQYTVSVGGHAVATGVATGDFASGSFTMPELGKTTFATQIAAVVAHEDIEQSPWTTTAPLLYEAPAAAAVPEAPVAKPAPHAAVHAPAPVLKPHAAMPSAPAAPPHAAAKPRPAPVQHEARPRPTAAKPRAHVRPHARVTVPTRTIPRRELPEPPRVAPLVTVVSAPRHTAWPLALALLLLAAVPPAAAYGLRRRKPGPEPPDDIEAELQEIIAEERARQRVPR